MEHPQPTSFAQWLDAAQRGDGSGFDALYRWLGGPITRFAVGRGASDPEAITNDVFVSAFRSIATFDGDALGFRAWLYSIARNKLIDAHRWQQRRPATVDAALADRAVPGADDEMLIAQAGERAAAMLTCLTSEQRDVILLRVIAELSLQETATVVAKPVTAVKRLQARGLQRLRAEFVRNEVSS